jgi:hypothetical protein
VHVPEAVYPFDTSGSDPYSDHDTRTHWRSRCEMRNHLIQLSTEQRYQRVPLVIPWDDDVHRTFRKTSRTNVRPSVEDISTSKERLATARPNRTICVRILPPYYNCVMQCFVIHTVAINPINQAIIQFYNNITRDDIRKKSYTGTWKTHLQGFCAKSPSASLMQ